MRILVCSFTTPGYGPNELAQYLETTEHTFQLIQAPAKHERRFIPGVSHAANIRQVGKEALGDFDLAIVPDPSLMIALQVLKKAGRVAKTVYWRLDYFPRKYPGPFDKAYQWLERNALDTADEVWSMADPELPHVSESLGREAKHVPYLMPSEPRYTGQRVRAGFWMGPDLDGSRVVAQAAADTLDIRLNVADYNDEKLRMDQGDLEYWLNASKVGLALYKPDRWKPEPTAFRSSKYFCDSSRIRRFLAHGVPVVTTDVAPTHTTVLKHHAGYVVPTCETGQVMQGIEYCLDHFDELSENAYEAAAEFTYPAWFEKHGILEANDN